MWVDKFARLMLGRKGEVSTEIERGDGDSKPVQFFHRPAQDTIKSTPSSARESAIAIFESWDEACAASTGYDASVILERVRGSALAVRRGEAAFERDSVRFDEPQYRWQMLACIASEAAQLNGQIHIADFGGSLGSVYFQHLPFLSTWPGLQWSIIEQPHFVSCGRAEFEDGTLRFFESFNEAAARAPVDVVLFSGSLQYPRCPYEIIASATALHPSAIIICRIPFTAMENDILTVQNVPIDIYPASYPAWILSEFKLKTQLGATGYVEYARYHDSIDPQGYIGILFRRNDRC